MQPLGQHRPLLSIKENRIDQGKGTPSGSDDETSESEQSSTYDEKDEDGPSLDKDPLLRKYFTLVIAPTQLEHRTRIRSL
jgi:hypothetical protein